MSLVTRCPACGTAFKVVRDQLRISDGWVRCGRCSEVFDATLALQEAPGAAPATGAAVSTGEVAGDAPSSARAKSAPLPFAGLVTDEPWPEPPASMIEADPHVVPPYPSFPPFPDIDLSLSAAPSIGGEVRPAGLASKPPSAATAEEDAANVQLQKALRRARAKSAKIARAKARGEERAARESAPVVLAASEPEPVPDNPRRLPRFASATAEGGAFWERTGVRRALTGVAVFAAVVLVVQVLHQERDLIAARQPSMRPVLAALCGLTGCELSGLRQIGDITIDGASFAREKVGDAYRLNFTLRNAAPVPLAMPAVELSLLDTQERTVVRRVLMPSEFGAPPVLPARAERAASLPLALSGSETATLPPVAGFHLLAFYP